jgi:D-glycero-D-manno-heptose 1,7-bisphosphate phosphatase
VPANSNGPAIFLDRDGVINKRIPDDYILNWSQFEFMPGIREALRQISQLGLPMVVVSNQSAIGRGRLTRRALEDITDRLTQDLLNDGVSISAYYYCIHRPDENCLCRKPQPLLLHEAAAELNLNLGASVFIGDSESDVEAARLAGCMPVLFGPGLNTISNSRDWMAGVPAATTADELFAVTVRCLHGHVSQRQNAFLQSIQTL